MFNNLIESSSHAKEFKRRGSFLLFTTATYAVLFVVTGVVSIYAYDAHLETQGTELEITFVPLRPTEEEPQPVKNTIRSASNSDSNETRSTRTRLIDSVDNPNNVPPKISTVAESVPPARFDSIIGDRNVDPPTRPGNNRGVPNGTGNNTVVTIPDDPPPPVPNPKPVVHKVLKVSDGVLRGTAILLPQPTYSPIAKQLKIQGTVSVQILIDEQGKVISAEVISGPQMLIHEARRAALQARFTPTKLSGQPVKVSGVITYRFILGQ